jgi:Family of unknown function (DUF5694)
VDFGTFRHSRRITGRIAGLIEILARRDGKMKILCSALLLASFLLLGAPMVNAQEKGPSGQDSCPCASRLLNVNIEDGAKTQLLVLGTPHLRTLKESFRPAQLDTLIAALEKYKPDLIGVESMSGSLIGELERKGDRYKEVLDEGKDKDRIENGHAAQKVLGLNRDESEQKADSLLKNLPTKSAAEELEHARSTLVLALVAAYDINTALLQWSYLPEELQVKNEVVPDKIAKYLSDELKRPDEVADVSIRLARQLGLQTIESVDDYEYADIFAPIEEQFMKELSASPLYEATVKSSLYVDSQKSLHRAAKDGDLLPYYLYMNSDKYSAPDVQTQWNFFFRTHFASGYDRTQVALWEVRNLDIASHIRRATALHPGKRMLMTIGAAHRPFLEAYFCQMMDVNIVHLTDFASKR